MYTRVQDKAAALAQPHGESDILMSTLQLYSSSTDSTPSYEPPRMRVPLFSACNSLRSRSCGNDVVIYVDFVLSLGVNDFL